MTVDRIEQIRQLLTAYQEEIPLLRDIPDDSRSMTFYDITLPPLADGLLP